jgi:hypothetical protein
VTTTHDTLSPAELQARARDAYRESVEQGTPLSWQDLGGRFGRSPSWARDRIAEVKGESDSDQAASAVASVVAPTAPVVAPTAEAEAPVVADNLPAVAEPVDAPPVAPADNATPAPDNAADSAPTAAPVARRQRVAVWPVYLLALPAFVAIWGGWVGLGEMTGFGPVNLLPGIGDGWTLNTAITLPIGVEAYAAYALRVWLSGIAPTELARRFAMWSAIGSLTLGAAGQVAYHLLDEAGITAAPWWITTFVSCLPVVVLGCGAALVHLLHNSTDK